MKASLADTPENAEAMGARASFATLQLEFDDLRKLQIETRQERDCAREGYWALRAAIGVPKEATSAEALETAAKLRGEAIAG